ncbi:MAG TPA: flagellar basal body rod protein FlgB, partial [Planctomycetota bacterium]|nr:flagellar basal body rod protein FlgB [Planctomycetota bacterium]
ASAAAGGRAAMNAFERGLAPIARALEAAALRFRTIQSNLAHVSTPGYRRLEVKFESLLSSRTGSATPSADDILAVEPHVVRDESPGRADGNNVSLEHEMAEQERARLQYEALLEVATLRIQGIRNAITSH